MAHAAETLERAEHTAHAGHDGDSMSTRIGITMAMLGVLLAFASARVGFERAEMVQYMIDQQHAHLKYQAQDIKHRMSVLSLRQLHATKADAAEMALMAQSVNRYLAESQAAGKWVDSFDPVIAAHSQAQEEYEHAQLAAELGIVVASIALLVRRRRIPWMAAIVLGGVAVAVLGITYRHTAHTLAGSEAKIEEAEKEYRTLRAAGKTTEIDQALVDEVLKPGSGSK